MLIFDAHLDLAWNALDWNRDLCQPVAETLRRREREQHMSGKGRGESTVSFPELRRGGVGIFIATLLARLLRANLMPAIQRYEVMEAAYAAAHGQLAYYRVLERQGALRFIRDAATLKAHVAERMKDETAGPLGFILSMEGADPVLSPEQMDEWWRAGLRIIGPAHYGISPYAHGTGTVGGLFPQGPALLKEMERVGMILDVTHLSDQCFDEALDIYGGPVLASHHNCRALVPDQRQLTDAQVQRLVGRGAVIGAAFDAWMLYPGWVRGETRPEQAGVTIATVVDHIDHVCQLAGNADHAGIGTDLDGGFGLEQSPCDLDTIADLQQIPELLRQRGYSEADVEKIAHGNWVRFFCEAWGECKRGRPPGQTSRRPSRLQRLTITCWPRSKSDTLQQSPLGQQAPSGQHDLAAATIAARTVRAAGAARAARLRHRVFGGRAARSVGTTRPIRATRGHLRRGLLGWHGQRAVRRGGTEERDGHESRQGKQLCTHDSILRKELVWFVMTTQCQRGGEIASSERETWFARTLTEPDAAENVEGNGREVRRIGRPAALDGGGHRRERPCTYGLASAAGSAARRGVLRNGSTGR